MDPLPTVSSINISYYNLLFYFMIKVEQLLLLILIMKMYRHHHVGQKHTSRKSENTLNMFDVLSSKGLNGRPSYSFIWFWL